MRRYSGLDDLAVACKAMEGVEVINGLECKMSCSSYKVTRILRKPIQYWCFLFSKTSSSAFITSCVVVDLVCFGHGGFLPQEEAAEVQELVTG